MIKGGHYRSDITTGDGQTHHAGDWSIVSLTDKSLKLQMIEQPRTIWGEHGLAGLCKPGETVQISRAGKGPHVLREWSDGSFTVYANQDGTPHCFEAIEEGKQS